jgi:S1-C subfamily serine protease
VSPEAVQEEGGNVTLPSVIGGGSAPGIGFAIPSNLVKEIVSVDGTATPTTGALSAVLAELKPGRNVPILVRQQSGAKTTSHVTLGTFPGG